MIYIIICRIIFLFFRSFLIYRKNAKEDRVTKSMKNMETVSLFHPISVINQNSQRNSEKTLLSNSFIHADDIIIFKYNHMYTTSLPVLIYLDHMIALLFITLCNTNVQILILMDMTELEIACAVHCSCKSSVACKILVLSILITRSFLLLLSKHLTFHLCRA